SRCNHRSASLIAAHASAWAFRNRFSWTSAWEIPRSNPAVVALMEIVRLRFLLSATTHPSFFERRVRSQHHMHATAHQPLAAVRCERRMRRLQLLTPRAALQFGNVGPAVPATFLVPLSTPGPARATPVPLAQIVPNGFVAIILVPAQKL